MTISTSSSVTTLLGNGATTVFNFSFIYSAASDIEVTYTDLAGTQTTLLPAQYTLSLNPPSVGQIWGVGGSVTYPLVGSPIATGTSLTIKRILPYTQTVSISDQGNFYPQVIEAALDKLCMEIQQTAARFGSYRGEWATGNPYNFGDFVLDGVNGLNTGNYYGCIISNVSTVWADDLADGDWMLLFNVQPLVDAVTTAVTAAATATTQAGISTTQAGIATSEADAASISETNAAASATAASNYANSYSGTSTTSLAIGVGAKIFTTQSGKLFVTGQFIQIASNADTANYMHGTVTTYTGTTLTMNILDIGGSGTHADWNISISGSQGTAGTAAALANNHIFVGNGANQATDVAMSGDATIASGGALTIANNAVTLAKMATQAAGTILANVTSGVAVPTAATRSQVVAILGFPINNFRLSLTTGVPVTPTDVTGATTIYCVPYDGNSISLYDGTNWNIHAVSEFSIALGTLSNGKPYDVFCYNNSGNPTLELTAWTNDSTRATALTYQNGVLSKSGAVTRRYLGTFYTTSTTTTEDSLAKRYLYNYYHRAKRPMYVTDSTSSWTYTTATLRQANGNTANQLDFIQGVAEDDINIIVAHAFGNSTSARVISAIGLDSTSTQHANCISGQNVGNGSGLPQPLKASLNIIPAAGRHFASWLEYSEASGTTTWYTANIGSFRISGIIGEVMA